MLLLVRYAAKSWWLHLEHLKHLRVILMISLASPPLSKFRWSRNFECSAILQVSQAIATEVRQVGGQSSPMCKPLDMHKNWITHLSQGLPGWVSSAGITDNVVDEINEDKHNHYAGTCWRVSKTDLRHLVNDPFCTSGKPSGVQGRLLLWCVS